MTENRKGSKAMAVAEALAVPVAGARDDPVTVHAVEPL